MKNCATDFVAIILLVMFGSDTLSALDPNPLLTYSTLLGPRKNKYSYMKYLAIGADDKGCAVVSTSLPVLGFPITPDACKKDLSQTALTRLSPDGSSSIYSSFFGAPMGLYTLWLHTTALQSNRIGIFAA